MPLGSRSPNTRSAVSDKSSADTRLTVAVTTLNAPELGKPSSGEASFPGTHRGHDSQPIARSASAVR
jgi:hypothetical protein